MTVYDCMEYHSGPTSHVLYSHGNSIMDGHVLNIHSIIAEHHMMLILAKPSLKHGHLILAGHDFNLDYSSPVMIFYPKIAWPRLISQDFKR